LFSSQNFPPERGEQLNQDDLFIRGIPINTEVCKFKKKGRKNKNGKSTREPSDLGINAGQ
jgi:hypothetical protein